MREDELLEGVHLVLQRHEVGYSLIPVWSSDSDHQLIGLGNPLPFIWIVNRLEADIFLILEKTFDSLRQYL